MHKSFIWAIRLISLLLLFTSLAEAHSPKSLKGERRCEILGNGTVSWNRRMLHRMKVTTTHLVVPRTFEIDRPQTWIEGRLESLSIGPVYNAREKASDSGPYYLLVNHRRTLEFDPLFFLARYHPSFARRIELYEVDGHGGKVLVPGTALLNDAAKNIDQFAARFEEYIDSEESGSPVERRSWTAVPWRQRFDGLKEGAFYLAQDGDLWIYDRNQLLLGYLLLGQQEVQVRFRAKIAFLESVAQLVSHFQGPTQKIEAAQEALVRLHYLLASSIQINRWTFEFPRIAAKFALLALAGDSPDAIQQLARFTIGADSTMVQLLNQPIQPHLTIPAIADQVIKAVIGELPPDRCADFRRELGAKVREHNFAPLNFKQASDVTDRFIRGLGKP